MKENFDKHPGILTVDKTDPRLITAVALRVDERYDSSVRITTKDQLIEAVLWLLNAGKDLP